MEENKGLSSFLSRARGGRGGETSPSSPREEEKGEGEKTHVFLKGKKGEEGRKASLSGFCLISRRRGEKREESVLPA